MPVIQSLIEPNSEDFARNREVMLAYINEFREVEQKVVEKANEAKDKFINGALLPRERLNLCWICIAHFWNSAPGWLSKCMMTRTARWPEEASIAGIGYVSGIRCLVVLSNSAIKGGTISPAGLINPCDCKPSPWRTSCQWSHWPKARR